MKQKVGLSKDEIDFTLAEIEKTGYGVITRGAANNIVEKFGFSEISLMRRAGVSKVNFDAGTTWDEYQKNPEWGGKRKFIVFHCDGCGKLAKITLGRFRQRRHKVRLCGSHTPGGGVATGCYFASKAWVDDEWIRKNSEAQKIAQNKPETIKKQQEAQKRRWELGGDELREQYAEIGRELWRRKEYRENQINKLRENWKNPEFRDKVFSSYRQYIGEYMGNRYYSLVELSFLLWCELNKKVVKNYDGEGIVYEYEGKRRRYYPDYIVDGNTIVEVKGHGRWYNRDRGMVDAKFNALIDYCKKTGKKCRMVFDTDLGKKLWNVAKEVHLENKK